MSDCTTPTTDIIVTKGCPDCGDPCCVSGIHNFIPTCDFGFVVKIDVSRGGIQVAEFTITSQLANFITLVNSEPTLTFIPNTYAVTALQLSGQEWDITYTCD